MNNKSTISSPQKSCAQPLPTLGGLDNGSECCGTEREEKHVQIDRALNELKGCIEHAEGIAERIVGHANLADPNCNKKEKPHQSLENTLNSTPDIIYQHVKHMHNLLSNIENSLF